MRRWGWLLLALAAGAWGAELEVRVRDAGRPAGGVKARALPLTEAGDLAYGGTVASGVTARNGICRLAGLDRGPYRVEVQAAGRPLVTHDLSFPASGACYALVNLPRPAGPTALAMTAAAAAPAGRATPLTVRLLDDANRPVGEGAWVRLATSSGTLHVAAGRGRQVQARVQGGRAAATLTPGLGPAEVTATWGTLEATATVVGHGPLDHLLLDQGPPEPVNDFAHLPPGGPLVARVTACDRENRAIPGVPLRVWARGLPSGGWHETTITTGPAGHAFVTVALADDLTRYRVVARHDRLEAVTEFLVAEPRRPWLETRLSWAGWEGSLALTLHHPHPDEAELTCTVEPAGRVLVLGSGGGRSESLTLGPDGQQQLTLLRQQPGPATLLITCDRAPSAWLSIGSTDPVLPPPAPAPAVALPEPGYQLPMPQPEVPPAAAAGPSWAAVERAGDLLGYRLGGSAARRLLATERALLGPVWTSAKLAALTCAVAGDERDPRVITLRTHDLVLGPTATWTVTVQANALWYGLARVWDRSADGRLLLLTGRPLPLHPPVVPVWVTDLDGQAILVSAAWRQVTGARFAGSQVVVAGQPLEGTPPRAVYAPVEQAPPDPAPAEPTSATGEDG